MWRPVDRRGGSVQARSGTGRAVQSDSGEGDSTDALDQPKFSTGRRVIPRTLLTRFGDSGDATRGYPVDSTDESNSLNLITFD